jgi:AcrR family transcriptional regulator
MARGRGIGLDRAQVVATAAKLADAEGIEHLTLARVAAELGVRLPSLYNHVDGLPGLRHALSLYALQAMLEQLRDAAIGKSGENALMSLAQAYRQYVLAHPGMYSLTVAVSDDPEAQRLSNQILGIFLAVLQGFALDEPQQIHALRGLRSIVHGFATIEAAGGFGIPIDLDASFRFMVLQYVASLAS